MLHASPRMPVLKGVALSVALLLAAVALCHANETNSPTGARVSTIPVKAPARSKRPAKALKWNWSLEVPASPQATPRPYSAGVAWQHAQTLSLELTVFAVASVYIAIDQWGWGETRFHLYREGWFGKNTGYGGIDKLGHAWSAHVMSDYLTWRLQTAGFGKYESAITAALLSGAAFLVVEIGDGFSHYGASYEDLIASAAGIGFSFLRNTVPGMGEKVDFRMQYLPTGHGDALGLGDYSGKKFLLAWKLAGFEAFRDGPLRYLEIHTGYYTRGYYDWEQAVGIQKTRSPYVGIGLNLAELLFSHPSVSDTTAASLGRTVLKHIQVPYTYIANGGVR
jgi:Predicted periplasmic lipoprotein (DUF2279)